MSNIFSSTPPLASRKRPLTSRETALIDGKHNNPVSAVLTQSNKIATSPKKKERNARRPRRKQKNEKGAVDVTPSTTKRARRFAIREEPDKPSDTVMTVENIIELVNENESEDDEHEAVGQTLPLTKAVEQEEEERAEVRRSSRTQKRSRAKSTETNTDDTMIPKKSSKLLSLNDHVVHNEYNPLEDKSARSSPLQTTPSDLYPKTPHKAKAKQIVEDGAVSHMDQISLQFVSNARPISPCSVVVSGPKTAPSVPPVLPEELLKKMTKKKPAKAIAPKKVKKPKSDGPKIVKSIIADIMKDVQFYIKTTEKEKKARLAQLEREAKLALKLKTKNPELVAEPIEYPEGVDPSTITMDQLSKRRVKIAAYEKDLQYSSIINIYKCGRKPRTVNNQDVLLADGEMQTTIMPSDEVSTFNVNRFLEYKKYHILGKKDDIDTTDMQGSQCFEYPTEVIALNETNLWSLTSMYNLEDWNQIETDENSQPNVIGTQHFQDFYKKIGTSIFSSQGAKKNKDENGKRYSKAPKSRLFDRKELDARTQAIKAAFQGEIDRRTHEVEEQIRVMRTQLNRWVMDQIVLRDTEIDTMKQRYELAYLQNIKTNVANGNFDKMNGLGTISNGRPPKYESSLSKGNSTRHEIMNNAIVKSLVIDEDEDGGEEEEEDVEEVEVQKEVETQHIPATSSTTTNSVPDVSLNGSNEEIKLSEKVNLVVEGHGLRCADRNDKDIPNILDKITDVSSDEGDGIDDSDDDKESVTLVEQVEMEFNLDETLKEHGISLGDLEFISQATTISSFGQ